MSSNPFESYSFVLLDLSDTTTDKYRIFRMIKRKTRRKQKNKFVVIEIKD
jgi:hypothetical protein